MTEEKPKSIKKQQYQEFVESGRLIIEAIKKNEINPTSLLQLLKQREQSKLKLKIKKNKKTIVHV